MPTAAQGVKVRDAGDGVDEGSEGVEVRDAGVRVGEGVEVRDAGDRVEVRDDEGGGEDVGEEDSTVVWECTCVGAKAQRMMRMKERCILPRAL